MMFSQKNNPLEFAILGLSLRRICKFFFRHTRYYGGSLHLLYSLTLRIYTEQKKKAYTLQQW